MAADPDLVRRTLDRIARAAAAAAERSEGAERALVAAAPLLRRSRAGRALLRRTLAQLVPRLRAADRSFRTVDVAGCRIVVDTASRPGQLLYFERRAYEEPVTRLVMALQPGETFVDVGANVGFFSILAALRVGPHGRVVAFEPSPEVRADLERAIAANGVEGRVTIVEAALSESAGETPLFVSDRESGVSSVVPDRAPLPRELFSRTVTVQTQTLDHFVRTLRLDPALVKIDVEGAEDLVLLGFQGTLSVRPPPTIVCETAIGSRADALLRRFGYTARPLDAGDIGNVLYERTDPAAASGNAPR